MTLWFREEVIFVVSTTLKTQDCVLAPSLVHIAPLKSSFLSFLLCEPILTSQDLLQVFSLLKPSQHSYQLEGPPPCPLFPVLCCLCQCHRIGGIVFILAHLFASQICNVLTPYLALGQCLWSDYIIRVLSLGATKFDSG